MGSFATASRRSPDLRQISRPRNRIELLGLPPYIVLIFIYLVIFLSAVPRHPWFGEEVGGFTVAKYLGLLCLLYAVFAMCFRSGLPSFLVTWPARFFVVLTAWGIFSCLFVSNAVAPFAIVQPFVSYLAIFVAIVICVNSLRRLQFAALALIGALDLASLYFLREYQNAGFGATRAAGWVVGDGNYFACAALLTIPIAYQLISSTREQTLKWFYRGSLFLTILAVVTSGSRGALAGLCAIIGMALLSSKNKFGALAACMLIVLVLLVAPGTPIKRIVSPGYGDVTSTEAHEALWKFGMRMVLEHPLFGIGVGNFKPYTVTYHVTARTDGFEAHNAYIHLAAETGVLGFLLYFGVNISAILLLEQIRKGATLIKHAYLYLLATGIQHGIVGFAVAAFFISAQSEKPFWIVISLAATMPLLLRQQLAASKINQPHSASKLNPTRTVLAPGLSFHATFDHGDAKY